MKPYQYMIVFKPKDKDLKPAVIKDVTTILARDEKEAAMKVTRAIPAQYEGMNLDDRLDEVEVIVRPF